VEIQKVKVSNFNTNIKVSGWYKVRVSYKVGRFRRHNVVNCHCHILYCRLVHCRCLICDSVMLKYSSRLQHRWPLLLLRLLLSLVMYQVLQVSAVLLLLSVSCQRFWPANNSHRFRIPWQLFSPFLIVLKNATSSAVAVVALMRPCCIQYFELGWLLSRCCLTVLVGTYACGRVCVLWVKVVRDVLGCVCGIDKVFS